MQMICRECKRIITLSELGGYACGHFVKLFVASGLAICLAQTIKDYFANKTKGFVDETMAGACNGLLMACPKCQKTSCWDPLPEIGQKLEEKQQIVSNSPEGEIKESCN